MAGQELVVGWSRAERHSCFMVCNKVLYCTILYCAVYFFAVLFSFVQLCVLCCVVLCCVRVKNDSAFSPTI